MEGFNIFTHFVTALQKRGGYLEVLGKYEKEYNLKKYKITEILDVQAISMYLHIMEK